MAQRKEPTPEEERREHINPSVKGGEIGGPIGGRIGGHKGGEAALHSSKVSAAELQLYLKGINYPARKRDLITAAKSNGAPSNVMDFINQMPEKQYGGPNMVEEEFSRLK